MVSRANSQAREALTSSFLPNRWPDYMKILPNEEPRAMRRMDQSRKLKLPPSRAAPDLYQLDSSHCQSWSQVTCHFFVLCPLCLISAKCRVEVFGATVFNQLVHVCHKPGVEQLLRIGPPFPTA